MKKISHFSLLILVFLSLLSCNRSVVFEQEVVFPNANWTFENKKIPLKVPLSGSEQPRAVIVELELNGIPNVDKFSAVFTIVSPQGGKTMKPIVFNFNSPQVPYIQGNSPNEKIYRLTVYPKKYFYETGTYDFEIDQLSNKGDNYGIRALRLRIEKVKE